MTILHLCEPPPIETPNAEQRARILGVEPTRAQTQAMAVVGRRRAYPKETMLQTAEHFGIPRPTLYRRIALAVRSGYASAADMRSQSRKKVS